MTGFRNMDRSSFDKGLVDVFLEYTSGATGAIPAVLDHAKGIASVVRNSQGNITVTFNDGYLGIAGIDGSIEQATPSFVTAWMIGMPVTAVGATPPTVTFDTLGADAVSGLFTAQDTLAGDKVRVHFTLRRL